MDPVLGTSQPPPTLVVKEALVPDADQTEKSVSLFSVPSGRDSNVGHGLLAADHVVVDALLSYASPDSEESVSVSHVLSESFLALSTNTCTPPALLAEAPSEPDAVPDSEESISILGKLGADPVAEVIPVPDQLTMLRPTSPQPPTLSLTT